jgi:hypothetical protein
MKVAAEASDFIIPIVSLEPRHQAFSHSASRSRAQVRARRVVMARRSGSLMFGRSTWGLCYCDGGVEETLRGVVGVD